MHRRNHKQEMTVDSQSTGLQITNKPQDRYGEKKTSSCFLYKGGMYECMLFSGKFTKKESITRMKVQLVVTKAF